MENRCAVHNHKMKDVTLGAKSCWQTSGAAEGWTVRAVQMDDTNLLYPT